MTFWEVLAKILLIRGTLRIIDRVRFWIRLKLVERRERKAARKADEEQIERILEDLAYRQRNTRNPNDQTDHTQDHTHE